MECVEQLVLPGGSGRAKHGAHVHVHMLLMCMYT